MNTGGCWNGIRSRMTKNMCGIDVMRRAMRWYRTPLGRGHSRVANPGRWPGLRDDGPLGLNSRRRSSAKGAQSLSPAYRAGSRNASNSCGPTGCDNGGSFHRPYRTGFSANGAQSLSLGHRPRLASPTNITRPERPRYDGRQCSRTPNEILQSLAKLETEIQQGMKELEGMLK